MYTPSINNLRHVIDALKGWPDNPDILAPCYFPGEEVVEDLIRLFESGSPVSSAVLDTLAHTKAEALNSQAMILNFPIRSQDFFQVETKDFIYRIKQERDKFIAILQREMPLNEKTVALFNRYLAMTSPILFTMGFTDAVSHCSQVGRRCTVEASRRGGTPFEILQSAFTGWLHDPKLARGSSWSNMATHPIVACTIIHEIYTDPAFRSLMDDVAANLEPPANIAPQKAGQYFIDGVGEALSINNDSRFVLENVILHKPKFYSFESDPGLADELPEIKDIAYQRFESPAAGLTPEPIPMHLDSTLRSMEFETGLRGIRKSILSKALSVLVLEFTDIAGLSPDAFYHQVTQGILHDPALIYRLSTLLKSEEHCTQECHVKAIHLFSHHDEVEKGRLAAWSLAVSDPLLLSPHKLLIEGNSAGNDCLSRLSTFLQSFSANIRWLPKDAQESGKRWQFDLYMALLHTAQELTHRSRVPEFEAVKAKALESNGRTLSLDESLAFLEKLILEEKTWQSDDELLNYVNLEPGDPEFYRMYRALEKHYNAALDSSPEMFGPVLTPISSSS